MTALGVVQSWRIHEIKKAKLTRWVSNENLIPFKTQRFLNAAQEKKGRSKTAASWLWRAFSSLNTFCNYTPSRSADRKISVTFEKEGRKQLGLMVGFAIQQPRPTTSMEALSGKAHSDFRSLYRLLFEMSRKMIFFFSKSELRELKQHFPLVYLFFLWLPPQLCLLKTRIKQNNHYSA